MGWITAVLASDLARKALGLLLASFTIILFLLNLRRAGERTGRLAERLHSTEKTNEIQRQMLDAVAHALSEIIAIPRATRGSVQHLALNVMGFLR